MKKADMYLKEGVWEPYLAMLLICDRGKSE